MRRATLTLDAMAIGKSPTEAAATTTDKQLRESVDCRDYYNTVIKFYDWGKTKYICENWKINPVRLIFNTLVGTVLYRNHGVMS
ncbi:MAG: hypothetical protein WCF23_10825 [Candidatus Nitrosopolaris sp.]